MSNDGQVSEGEAVAGRKWTVGDDRAAIVERPQRRRPLRHGFAGPRNREIARADEISAGQRGVALAQVPGPDVPGRGSSSSTCHVQAQAGLGVIDVIVVIAVLHHLNTDGVGGAIARRPRNARHQHARGRDTAQARELVGIHPVLAWVCHRRQALSSPSWGTGWFWPSAPALPNVDLVTTTLSPSIHEIFTWIQPVPEVPRWSGARETPSRARIHPTALSVFLVCRSVSCSPGGVPLEVEHQTFVQPRESRDRDFRRCCAGCGVRHNRSISGTTFHRAVLFIGGRLLRVR